MYRPHQPLAPFEPTSMMSRFTVFLSLLFLGHLCSVASSFAPIPWTTATVARSASSRQASAMYAVNDENNHQMKSSSSLPKLFAMGMIALAGPININGNMGHPPPTVPVASASEIRVVGQLKGSGLVFKDTLQIESFDDPKVKGVTLYLSNFQRPITERLSSNFFSDPSATSVGCAKTGPVQIADNIVTGVEGEEVFKEKKSLLFKDLRVERIYDQPKNTMVYIVFNTRLDKNDDSNKSRFKSSLCAVNLGEDKQTKMAKEGAEP